MRRNVHNMYVGIRHKPRVTYPKDEIEEKEEIFDEVIDTVFVPQTHSDSGANEGWKHGLKLLI